MDVVDLRIPDLKLVRPRVFQDDRGSFTETYRQSRYHEHGMDAEFVQDNHSQSSRGTLRGLHFQWTPGQAKLIRVVHGRIFDVAVDLRPESPTFGHWESVELIAERHEQLYMPVGFAHGFCVLSERADVIYKVSSDYDASTEGTLAFDDPLLAIPWPVSDPQLSPRDREGMSLAAVRERLGA
jgi:dTDP-4-dehydrorhamnose 3,5-epimerase